MTPTQARQLLGLKAGADEAAIDQAYRVAVKAAHPDRDGGDVERLRLVIEAHRLLKSVTPEPINFAIAPRPNPMRAMQTPAQHLALQISVREAMFGGSRRLVLDGGRAVDVMLPAGLRTGESLRLAGAAAGEALMLRITVQEEKGLSVQGGDLRLEIDAGDAGPGDNGCVVALTPRGPRAFYVSEALRQGGMIRLRGEGLPARGSHPAGDLILSVSRREGLGRALLRRFTPRWAA